MSELHFVDIEEGDKFVVEVRNKMFGVPGEGGIYFIDGFNTLVFDDYGMSKLKRLEDVIQEECDRARREGYREGYNYGVKIGSAANDEVTDRKSVG